MLGLPQSTEVRKPLPKAQLYKRFGWKPSQRDSFDSVVGRLDFIHWISPKTVPAITEGTEIKEIFVIEVSLKTRNFDMKPIEQLAKSIPQRVIYLLRFEEEYRLAVYHSKLFLTDWQALTTNSSLLTTTLLNLDSVWENIVSSIGSLEVAEGNSLTEQIRADEERARLVRQIEALERLMRSTSQPRRQRELYAEIKNLKHNLNG